MDETTDVGAIKQCAFAIIFLDLDCVVKTRFLDMVATDKGDAASLYNCLRSTLAKHKIPFENMVGFSSDTTNVMVGKHNSIFSNLKRDLSEILCVRCSCHMIHLASSTACLQFPRSVEDVVRNIGAHFSRSYSRQCKFIEFQQFFRLDIHKILMPSNTRWLSSEQCVKRILEQYDPLSAYFRLALLEDPSKTTETIVKTLENKYTLIYLQFMSYILEILNDFNKLFQTEAPLLYKLKPETIRLLKTLCHNFLDIAYVIEEQNIFNINHTNPDKFVPLKKMYLGVMAFESIESLKLEDNFYETEMDVFLTSTLKFYIELVTEIKKRFQYSDDIFDLVSVVDPRESTISNISLLPIIKRFTFLRSIIDAQKLDNEWREHSLVNPQTSVEKKSQESLIKSMKNILMNNSQGRVFAVVHVAGKQFKVTCGDVIVIEGYWPPQVGDEINLDKILLAGSLDFTLVGRPMVQRDLIEEKKKKTVYENKFL
ncbi:hypothetical protein JTB14_003884 [Gonioctena quinquepunctata]|nr:hypothetical protein JTB14_003884 [Gonioctena quinquepunctata]